MTWPPTLPPNTFVNLDPQQDAHPDAHNLTSDALADIVDKINEPRVALSVGLTSPWTGTAYALRRGDVIWLHWNASRPVATLGGGFTIGNIPVNYRPTFGSVPACAAISSDAETTTPGSATPVLIGLDGAVTVPARCENLARLRFSVCYEAS